MPELIAPTATLRHEWLAAHWEWGPGRHEDGFGLLPSDVPATAAGFAAWIARLSADPGCTYRWIVEDGRVLGGIALRADGEVARRVGHIGFGVRPTARRRGLATWALRELAGYTQARGADRLLLVCAAGNVASARTIERCGGVLEGIVDTELGPVRRYRCTHIDRTGEPGAGARYPAEHANSGTGSVGGCCTVARRLR